MSHLAQAERELPGRPFAAVFLGLLQGAASGVGETQDLTNVGDAAMNAAKSGAIGAGIGAAAPVVVTGIAKGGDAVVNRGSDVISSLTPTARKYVDQYLSDPANLAAARMRLKELGPQAVLADTSPEFEAIARGSAAIPGTRNTVVNPLNVRDAGRDRPP